MATLDNGATLSAGDVIRGASATGRCTSTSKFLILLSPSSKMTSTPIGADVPKHGFIPAQQRVWRIVRKGEPSKALVLDNEAPVPTLRPGEVFVRVQAVSFHNVCVSLGFPPAEMVC